MKTEYAIRIGTTLKPFKGLPPMISYLSVFFILIVFAMIGTNFVQVQGIPVKLPAAGYETLTVSRNLVITIDKEGNIYFNDKIMNDMSMLIKALSDVPKEKGDTLLIRADVGSPLVKVLDIYAVAREFELNACMMTEAAVSSGRRINFSDME